MIFIEGEEDLRLANSDRSSHRVIALELPLRPQGLKLDIESAVQPGTCFTFQTGHILYTLGPIFGVWYFIFVVVAAEAVEMWESPLLGFPYFHRLIICL